jgi:hypothetical protein
MDALITSIEIAAMKTFSITVALACVISINISAQTKDSGQRFDTAPPDAARELVRRGIELAGEDRVDEAIAAVKKAIVIAPNYLEAAWRLLLAS